MLLSYLGIDPAFEALAYYDRLFWGSGHIIQFSHTQLMLVAWLWLASVSGAKLRLSPRVVLLLFILGLQPVLAAPVIYLAFEVSSGHHLFWFIQLMKYGGAIAAVPIGVAVALAIVEKWRPSPGFEVERNALLFSMLLFAAGGGIGFMISGSTVTVPAHYHGSIVGVTIAFMGISYHLLHQLGYARVSGRMARWQPGIYGGGQLMHIVGLAWSGGYNVARKSTDAERGIEQVAGMGLMGLGGLISIIGGIIFLLLMYRSLKAGRSDAGSINPGNTSAALSPPPADQTISRNSSCLRLVNYQPQPALGDAFFDQELTVLLVGTVDVIDQPVFEEIKRLLHRTILILAIGFNHLLDLRNHARMRSAMRLKVGVTILFHQPFFIFEVSFGVVDQFIQRLALENLSSGIVDSCLQTVNQFDQLAMLYIDGCDTNTVF